MSIPLLLRPSIEHFDMFADLWREYHKISGNFNGFTSEEALKNGYVSFIQKLEGESKGEGLREGYVPSTTFYLLDNGEYIGWGSIRYALTDSLKETGGHIGYEIRPSKRKQGYGSIQLRLLLDEAAKLGIKNALITCSSENHASRCVIENNGGVLIDCSNIIINGDVRPTLRYKAETGLSDGVLFKENKPWYHGSNLYFDVLQSGSTITQNRQLAEAFSHKPARLSQDDEGNITHNGTDQGVLYIIDESIIPGDNIYMHPRTTMDKGLEWITTKPLKVRPLG